MHLYIHFKTSIFKYLINVFKKYLLYFKLYSNIKHSVLKKKIFKTFKKKRKVYLRVVLVTELKNKFVTENEPH